MPAAPKRRLVSFAATLAAGLTAAGCVSGSSGPPREKGSFRRPDLVEIVTIDPTIRLDIRYATANNFTGRPVYRQARAFLQRPAADALVRVHRALGGEGYGLLVFDGYRPWSVTKLFWDITSPQKRAQGFVANPAKGSKHNRGAAVDLSLYELATGEEIAMPSGYDEFSERADPDYAGGTEEQRARRDLLRAVMEKEGFTVDPGEWWHYNYRDWESYPILDVPFEAIPPTSERPGRGRRGDLTPAGFCVGIDEGKVLALQPREFSRQVASAAQRAAHPPRATRRSPEANPLQRHIGRFPTPWQFRMPPP